MIVEFVGVDRFVARQIITVFSPVRENIVEFDTRIVTEVVNQREIDFHIRIVAVYDIFFVVRSFIVGESRHKVEIPQTCIRHYEKSVGIV